MSLTRNKFDGLPKEGPADPPQILLNLKSTARLLDLGSTMTLYRLRKDRAQNFPQPIMINDRPHWLANEVAEWAISRPRGE